MTALYAGDYFQITMNTPAEIFSPCAFNVNTCREIKINRDKDSFSTSLVLSTRKFRLKTEYKYKKQLNGDKNYRNS